MGALVTLYGYSRDASGPEPEAEAGHVPQQRESPDTSTSWAEPVTATERWASVDVLRGLALLGILAMNIVGFSWPGPAYGNPLRGAGFEGTDRAIWIFNHLVFEAKMMTIFSMLFGAGLVLMGERAAARGASFRGIYYRRVLWLLVIGAIHAYLIWDGDILFLYAECGLVLYLFRNKTPRTLIILGVVLLVGPHRDEGLRRVAADEAHGARQLRLAAELERGLVALHALAAPAGEHQPGEWRLSAHRALRSRSCRRASRRGACRR